MTEKRLKSLHYLKKEIAILQKELDRLADYQLYHSPQITDMPKTTLKIDKIAEYVTELEDVKRMINKKLLQMHKERKKIEQYLETIEDSETRLIFRLRHINCMTWRQISEEIQYETSTVRKKYVRYIKANICK